MNPLNVKYNHRLSPQETLNKIDVLLSKVIKAREANDGSEVEVTSKAVEDIAMLMGTLGYYVAEADADRDDRKDERDHYLIGAVIDYIKHNPDPETNKPPSDTAASKAVMKSTPYREKQVNYLEAERIYKRLNKKYQSVSKAFDGMRSRLAVVKGDMKSA